MTYTNFPVHGQCLLWTWPLICMIVAGESLTGLAFFLLSRIMLATRSQSEIKLSDDTKKMLLSFAAFHMACGLGHMMNVVLLWYSCYWSAAACGLVTAYLSVKAFVQVREKMLFCVGLLQETVDFLGLRHERDVMRRQLDAIQDKMNGQSKPTC